MNKDAWLLKLGSDDESEDMVLSEIFHWVMDCSRTGDLDTLDEVFKDLPVAKVKQIYVTGLLRSTYAISRHLKYWHKMRNRYIAHCVGAKIDYKHVLRGLLDDSRNIKIPVLIELHPSLKEEDS